MDDFFNNIVASFPGAKLVDPIDKIKAEIQKAFEKDGYAGAYTIDEVKKFFNPLSSAKIKLLDILSGTQEEKERGANFFCKEVGFRLKIDQAPTLESILKRCDRTSVLEKLQEPPIDMKLPWQGRKEEMEKIKMRVLRNMSAHLESTKTKQYYNFVLVHGASGIGKSRLCFEACKSLINEFPNFLFSDPDKHEICISDSVNKSFSSVHYLFTDFSLTDGISEDEILNKVGESVVLGLRLASSFFLQSRVRVLLSALKYLECESMIHEFTLENIASLISSHLPDGKNISLLWHFDEFPHLDTELVKCLIRELGNFMANQHKLRISITPLFSGTASVHISKALLVSNFSFADIFLQTIKRTQSEAIVVEVLRKYEEIKQIELRDQALHQLGDCPRFLQLFCENFALLHNSQCGADIEGFYALVLKYTRNSIKGYAIESWERLLCGSKTSLQNICLYAITRKRIMLHDKLNGLTIADICDMGILTLTRVEVPEAEKQKEQYFIDIPLILIRAMNMQYNFIDTTEEKLLDPRVSKEQAFENQMVAMKILRENLEEQKIKTQKRKKDAEDDEIEDEVVTKINK